jgi:hypothetical protein
METRLLIRGEHVEGAGAPLAVENPATEETVAEVRGPSSDQLDAAIAGAREAARGWASTPAVERDEMLHEVATRMRAMTDSLARAMTLEGRQAADRELRRGRVDGRGVRLLRRDGPQLRRSGDPLDRGDAARPSSQGAAGGMGLHRPVELPAAVARVEARAGAGGGERGGGEAVRAHASFHADARLVLLGPAAGRREPGGGRGRRGCLPRLG